MGATEELFTVDKTLSYRIIDVGGSRTQRNVWAQFFDQATAIIFLAPISAFDEVSCNCQREECSGLTCPVSSSRKTPSSIA
jgi:hypothetical protein